MLSPRRIVVDDFPAPMMSLITRNYGETADENVNELIRELGLAILIVSAFITFSLGWRDRG